MNTNQRNLVTAEINKIEALLAHAIKASSGDGVHAAIVALESISTRYGIESEFLAKLRRA